MTAALNLATECEALAQDLLAQPEFFEAHRNELPGASLDRQPLALKRYTGARAATDEHVNLKIGAMRLLGLSDRAIERECRVDRRTIPYRLAALERDGRIPALKERVMLQAGNLAEQSALLLRSLLDRSHGEVSVELAAMVKAVATSYGISVEKWLLLTGQATERIDVMVPGSGRAEAEAWWDAEVRACAVDVPALEPVDSVSRGIIPISKGYTGIPEVRHAADTVEPQPPPTCATSILSQPGAGGGSHSEADGRNGDGSTGC